MSLFSRMKSDNRRILSNTDMHDITLYDTTGNTYTGKGRFTAPGMYFNPQGQPVASKKWSIAFHLDSFTPTISVTENFKGWSGEFINSEGETIKGVFNGQLVNKTFGYVVTTLTENKVPVGN